MQSKYKHLILVGALALCWDGCTKKEPQSAVEKKESTTPAKPANDTKSIDTLKEAAAETGAAKAIGGTRWEYFDRKVADGTMQASVRIHASDDKFEDLPATLVVACQTVGPARVWVDADDARLSVSQVLYRVDDGAPVEAPAQLVDGVSMVFGGPPLAKSLMEAKTVSVEYATKGTAGNGKLYFLVSGLADLRPKLREACPGAGF